MLYEKKDDIIICKNCKFENKDHIYYPGIVYCFNCDMPLYFFKYKNNEKIFLPVDYKVETKNKNEFVVLKLYNSDIKFHEPFFHGYVREIHFQNRSVRPP